MGLLRSLFSGGGGSSGSSASPSYAQKKAIDEFYYQKHQQEKVAQKQQDFVSAWNGGNTIDAAKQQAQQQVTQQKPMAPSSLPPPTFGSQSQQMMQRPKYNNVVFGRGINLYDNPGAWNQLNLGQNFTPDPYLKQLMSQQQQSLGPAQQAIPGMMQNQPMAPQGQPGAMPPRPIPGTLHPTEVGAANRDTYDTTRSFMADPSLGTSSSPANVLAHSDSSERLMQLKQKMYQNPYTPKVLEHYDAKPQLGSVFTSFESGNQKGGSVSSGYKDKGGPSYGLYQFNTTSGIVQDYLKQSGYGAQFKGLTPGSADFNNKWKEIYKNDPQGFTADQTAYATKKYAQPAMNAFKSTYGFDPPPAVQEALFSMAIQHGNYQKILQQTEINKDMTPQQMVQNLYKARGQYVWNLDIKNKEAIINRYKAEASAVGGAFY